MVFQTSLNFCIEVYRMKPVSKSCNSIVCMKISLFMVTVSSEKKYVATKAFVLCFAITTKHCDTAKQVPLTDQSLYEIKRKGQQRVFKRFQLMGLVLLSPGTRNYMNIFSHLFLLKLCCCLKRPKLHKKMAVDGPI